MKMINKVNVDFKSNEQILEIVKAQMIAVCEGKDHLKHIETVFEYEQKENIHYYFCNAIYESKSKEYNYGFYYMLSINANNGFVIYENANVVESTAYSLDTVKMATKNVLTYLLKNI